MVLVSAKPDVLELSKLKSPPTMQSSNELVSSIFSILLRTDINSSSLKSNVCGSVGKQQFNHIILQALICKIWACSLQFFVFILSFLISKALLHRPPLALPASWKGSLCPGITKLSFIGNSFLKNDSSVLVVLKCSCSWKKSFCRS